MSPEDRKLCEGHAKALKYVPSPFMNSSSAVEDIFGYSLPIDFDGDENLNRATRTSWLKAIDMSDFWLEKGALEQKWVQTPPGQKNTILAKEGEKRSDSASKRLRSR
jgi:hypothetical protein